jgi:hypothetical protein
MDRKSCIKSLAALGVCCGVIPAMGLGSGSNTSLPSSFPPKLDDELAALKQEKEFIVNWVRDLLETMDKELDEETRIRLIEGCGRGCYNRFKFKQDIAEKGKGDLDKLIEAYSQNFEVWKDGNKVHVRYGAKSARCYCPAAKIRTPQPNDLHCECTRMTHQTIFETALGHPVYVEVVESLRRGGQTCHFLVSPAGVNLGSS